MGDIMIYLLFCVFVLMYFAPTFNAIQRRHMNLAPIAVVNIFLGWTLIGWVVCLAWSYSSAVRPRLTATRSAFEMLDEDRKEP
jgi:hypothetical protein